MSDDIPPTLRAADVTEWSDDVDVVVIGFGIAGGCAAVERGRGRRAGAGAGAGGRPRAARPRWPAGTSTSAAAPRCRRRPGHADSAEEMYKYLVAVSLEPEHDKIRAYCDGSVEHFDWLEDLGFQFERSYYPGKVVVPPGTEGLLYTGNEKVWPFCEQAKPAPRGHKVPVPGELGGAAMVIDLLVKRAEEARGRGPLRDRRDQPDRRRRRRGGRCRWKHFTETGAVKAKSVVIAAGGFVMNPEMVAEHTPALGRQRRTKHHGLVAPYILGIPTTTAWASGWVCRRAAPPRTWTSRSSPRRSTRPRCCSRVSSSTKRAKRFVAEDSYHSRTSAFVLEQPDQTAYLIVDEAHMEMPEMPLITFIDGCETVAEMETALGIPAGQPARDAEPLQRERRPRRGSGLPQAAGIRCRRKTTGHGRRSTSRWAGRCTPASPWAVSR